VVRTPILHIGSSSSILLFRIDMFRNSLTHN
jgi:hypothetical protein